MNLYHGTDYSNTQSIRTNNFIPSEKPDDWLGKGVYFFKDGISCPIDNAEEWAKASAHCKKTRSYKYTEYVVLSAQVNSENVLDTTTMEGLQVFHRLRRTAYEKIRTLIAHKKLNVQDKILWDFVANLLGCDVVVHNLYIKNIFERKNNINSNVPNCTVACVKNAVLIDVNSIQEVRKGLVV
jgi:hypothetical protein